MPGRRRRAEIARREHHGVGGQRSAVGEADPLAAVVRDDVDRLAGDDLEPVAGLGEQLGEIVAEQHARRIILGRRRRARRYQRAK